MLDLVHDMCICHQMPPKGCILVIEVTLVVYLNINNKSLQSLYFTELQSISISTNKGVEN